jgi:hypothetical protein
VAAPPVPPAAYEEEALNKNLPCIYSQVPPNKVAGLVEFIDVYILPTGNISNLSKD